MVHAVPGLVADVSVDGKTVLTQFTAQRVTDPVTLSAGKHTVTLQADNGPDAGKVVLKTALDVTAGTTSTAVIGFDPSGSPKAFVFPEAPLPVPDGKAGVVMRNVSATNAVRVLANGAPLTPQPLANGASTTLNVTAGAPRVTVTSPGGTTILGAQQPTLQGGRVTTLYLIGSPKDKSLAWVATTRLASSLVPLSSVPTGDGSTAGQAEMMSRTSVSPAVAAAIAAIMGLATYAVLRRRARPRADA